MPEPYWKGKHFELICEVISCIPDEDVRRDVAERFEQRLRETNERFDSVLFFKHCWVRL